VYSVRDLLKLKDKTLARKLARYMMDCLTHITTTCEICKGKGSICELCNQKNLLFPFQFGKVARCPSCFAGGPLSQSCNTLFHASCAKKFGIITPPPPKPKSKNSLPPPPLPVPEYHTNCPKCQRRLKLVQQRTSEV